MKGTTFIQASKDYEIKVTELSDGRTHVKVFGPDQLRGWETCGVWSMTKPDREAAIEVAKTAAQREQRRYNRAERKGQI